MEKRRITEEQVRRIREKYPDPSEGFVVEDYLLAKSTSYFCKYGLGLTPRVWQDEFWRTIDLNERVAGVTPRQVGKTVAGAAYCLQQALFNQMPVGFNKKTLILIVSATDEQAKEFLAKIKELIYVGDEHVKKLTGGKIEHFFSRRISRYERNDKTTLTFDNGCRIVSLPPTKKIRGNSPSLVWLDEVAFIEDQELYETAVKPLVIDTKGKIVMTTTPNGQQGFFFTLFDPFDERESGEYTRLWYDYDVLVFEDPERVSEVERGLRIAAGEGNEKHYRQENFADFTTQTGSFFDVTKVDECVDKGMEKYSSYGGECDLGIDFGKQTSRTVVSIVKLDEDNKTIRLLYQYEYPAMDDLSLMSDVLNLMNRFNVQRVVYEDCPAAEQFRQTGEKKGLNLQMFSPQGEKLKKYTLFRAKVHRGFFKMYDSRDLLVQMKGLQYEETIRTTRIFHGSGLRDDLVDSVVIASKFLLEEKKGISVFDWDDL